MLASVDAEADDADIDALIAGMEGKDIAEVMILILKKIREKLSSFVY